MYSFYGGRPGNPFVIVKAFGSQAQMKAAFAQGPNYTEVHYDEYVLINTTNKNDLTNGNIYRRGYDFNNAETHGAEYVGCIAGPSGDAPQLSLATLQQVHDLNDGTGRFSEGTLTITNDSLIPGKSGNSYNDGIQWAAYSVKDSNGTESIAYVGFKIPYTVIDFSTTAVAPYRNGTYTDTSSTTRTDSGTHPFYEHWNINIPKGIKGDSIKNIQVLTISEENQNIIKTINEGIYEGQVGQQILAYKVYKYDIYQNPQPEYYYYLGDYNMIQNVSVNETGDIIINYTHDDATVFEKTMKWINSIALDGETGDFTVDYNYDTDSLGNSTQYSTKLRWVNGIVLQSDGTVIVNYTDGDPVILPQKIKWIDHTEINNNGQLIIYYNNNTSTTVTIPRVTELKIHTEDEFNGGQGSGSQLLAYRLSTFNENDDDIEIGNPINYIMRAAINQNNEVLVLYSDPQRRALSSITYDGITGWTNLGTISISASLGGKVDMEIPLLKINTDSGLSVEDDQALYNKLGSNGLNWWNEVSQTPEQSSSNNNTEQSEEENNGE